jgi:3'-phosphoadenosine 5'-phosphosulfate sulfotransferase (PAPS reductase)/FAD synthetase
VGDSNAPKNKNQWWHPVEEAVAGLALKGQRVRCPMCHHAGFATTKWVKGPTVKPMYVLHFTRNRVSTLCRLDQEGSATVRSEVSIPESDIKGLLQSRRAFVLFSGGKDSLAALLYLKRVASQVNGELTALYVDTTAGLPENTEYVRDVCDYLEVDLKVATPRVDYFTLVRKWGIPSFRYRWCCRELKIKPIEEYLITVAEPKVVFDGIRAVESPVRKQYLPIWYHPSFKCLSVSPIFFWSDEEVFSLINSNGIPKTLLHSLGTSTECWCGAYKTEADFRKLYHLNKDVFHRLVEVEDLNQNKYTFLYENGHKKPLRSIERDLESGEPGASGGTPGDPARGLDTIYLCGSISTRGKRGQGAGVRDQGRVVRSQ